MKKVRVRKQHTCDSCGRTIKAGEQCYTYSIQYQGRTYLCLSCKSFKGTNYSNNDIEPDIDFLNGIY